MMDAQEAERCGLVSRIIPAAGLVDEAVRTAQKIAELSLPIVMMAKESVNRAFETTLNEAYVSSDGCSTPHSPSKIKRRECRPSWRSEA
jgi:enoyl-CoA hydratase/carnithine racemase